MVETFTADMHRRFPNDWPPAQTLSVVPESQILVNPMIDGVVLPAVATLTIVVGLVLLVACANLASFLLAQARDRQREVAIRLALGATRVVLVRQMLIEAILLAAIGGAIGVALSRLALGALLRAQLPLPLPITLDVTLDAHILAFAVLASLGAGVLFGLLPALQATRTAIAETIKNENTGGSRGRRVTLRGALVVGEVAVSLLLLITAALFLRSFRARATVDPGFGKAPAGLVWFAIPADRYPVPRRLQLVERIEDRIRATPGVEAVGLIDNMLLNLLSEQDKPVNVAGFRPPKGQPGFQVMWSAIDSGFFDAAGVTLVSGRSITAADGPDAPRVVVINEAMAKQFWPTVDPIGRTVRVDTTQYRVVGVARTTKVRTLGEAPRPFMFLSFRQSSSETVMMVARSRGDAEAVATEMLHALHAVDPSLMVIQSKTMARHLATMMLPARLGAFAFALFAAVGLTLAVIGVYGVVSYAVARRTREVGIRVAVGADPTAVIQLLMREGMILVVIGGVVGLALGFAVTRVLAGLLYGVATLDPLTFVAAPILLVGVGAAACFIPARRATAIDPAVVLRTE